MQLVQTNNDSTEYLLSLKNNENLLQQILLEIPIQQIDKITLSQISDNKVVKKYVFKSKKISDRIYYDRNIIFPFDIKANAKTNILFKYHNNDIHNYFSPEILIWKKDAKITRTEALELTRGVFYGILILFSFICFLLTIMLKIRNYYYYLLYLLSGIIYLFVKNNLGYELFWPNYPLIDTFMKKILLSVYLITSILFLRGFISKRIVLPRLQKVLKIFIYFGIVLIFISLTVGLLSIAAQHTFIIIQNIFVIICLTTVLTTFIFVYFNTNDRSLVLFSLVYFSSFTFFIFYPQPEFGSSFFGVTLGQIYTYSNAFIIAIIIAATILYRVMQIINNNEKYKKELSTINAQINFSLIEGQQKEQARIGRELHDGIGIMMSAIKMKISSLKPNNIKEKRNLLKITKNIDDICNNTRAYSHTLLPPTLIKFGIQIALKDMFENYKNQHKNLMYNFNIPSNLSLVSQHLIYDCTKNSLIYFTDNKPVKINISIYVIPSIKEAQIRIQYAGASLDTNHVAIKTIHSSVNLLNGKFQMNLLNAWNFLIHIEFPILTDD